MISETLRSFLSSTVTFAYMADIFIIMLPGLWPQVVAMIGVSILGTAKTTLGQAIATQTNIATATKIALAELCLRYFAIKIIRPFIKIN